MSVDSEIHKEHRSVALVFVPILRVYEVAPLRALQVKFGLSVTPVEELVGKDKARLAVVKLQTELQVVLLSGNTFQ
jgi:hypothetical protein